MSNTASYIGKEPTYGVFITQTETGDGSTVAFTLDATAATTASLLVSVGGVVQQPASAFTLNSAGTTLTFTGAPGSGVPIWILFLGQTLTTAQATSANTTMITGETALGTIPAAGDYFLLYDADAAALKKVAYSNLETGDIAGVTAGTGITGGGTSGTVTVAIDTAVTADLTTAQTMTNKVLTSPVVTTPQINDTSADHQYVFAVSELAADRTVTLPLLTGGDEFTFNAHAQTLTNKTLTSPDINTPDIDGGNIDGTIIGATTTAAGSFAALSGTSLTTTGAFTSLGIDDNADAVAITIDSSENVGIGQTSPAAKLHLKHATGGTYMRWQDGSSDYAYEWGVENGEGNAFLLKNITGGTTPLTLKTDGKIGIGVTAPTGTLDLNDGDIVRAMMKDYSETKVAMAAHTVDISLGNVQTYTLSGNQTLIFSNPIASGNSSAFTLYVTNGGSATLTWPAAVDWAGGTAPSLTSSGVDILVFTTIDGGTIWNGCLSGAGMA